MALAACRGFDLQTYFERSEAEHREEMTAMYPVGTPRRELTGWIEEFDSWDVNNPAPDRFAAIALQHTRSITDHQVKTCISGLVLRTSYLSTFGAFGLWQDYVFLDSDDQVVVAYRRWVD